ncbi:hypothetical protein K435DRAFT_766027 [Dendrothele bispora CBS 962.96]|uniref:DUF6533 domain-containing protein n=1 Tax=Dendrothele bispora (strain CBS 962.96) TaxID=1314807 RepID=A0A4S8L4B7_DENBC|nr:hypothetical protein K435DRAFT_766027 [Dendrothele bispora CBS 962.96]
MPESLVTAQLRFNAALYFQLGAFVMVLYDHILTFAEEVSCIWGQKLNGATLLFFINRYITPIEFIIVLVAFHQANWPAEVCDRFVAFEGGATIALVTIAELVMILRVYALYGRPKFLLFVLLSLLVGQVVISSIGIVAGFAAPFPPPLHGCVLTGTRALFPALWVAPLVLDSIIFTLTVWRTRRYLSQHVSTAYVLMRDGTIYFFLIFMANASNVIIYYSAADDLKAFGASFSQLITSVMISRLILNLRRPREEWENPENPPTRSKTKVNDVSSHFVSSAVEMLRSSVTADEHDGAVASRERFVRETIKQQSRIQPVSSSTLTTLTIEKEERFTTEIIEMYSRSRPTTSDSIDSSARQGLFVQK